MGSSATPIVMAFLIQAWGWREAFMITGLASLTWCIVWYLGFKDITGAGSNSKTSTEKVKIPWKIIFTNKKCCWGSRLPSLSGFLNVDAMTWVPSYLIMSRGFSIGSTMGFYMSLSYGIAAVSQPLVGLFSDWLIKRG